MYRGRFALTAAALGMLATLGLGERAIEARPQQVVINPRGAHGDGKKKRRSTRRYLVEMQHGKPGTRAKRRNIEYDRPARGNAGAGRGSRRVRA